MAKKKTQRSAATNRRLKMYNSRPKRDHKGKIIKHDLQSKKLPSTRIQPDPRWFINTRVICQKKLELFREEIQNRLSSNYNVILNESKLPMSLLNDHLKKGKLHSIDSEPIADACGPKAKRKCPKHIESVAKNDMSEDAVLAVHEETGPSKPNIFTGRRTLDPKQTKSKHF
ncbi:PREDICTED: nuclear/nucleolar GTPase 2-like [Nicotiana attenuata]|uniref:Nuclearnucleolar gtpase 2 n=1 Tax=Nicotiana attenuata TaxID=49451 RepID=A0A1J6I7E6_NICAT|nr:PREDICTED: nuclear/nucleolar GTPase 2-like [Nicotiana attenuata]OIT00434.1 nuclearnucleolar gtpase 2 [Nicotiana attenuata]